MNNRKEYYKFFKNTRSGLFSITFMYIVIGVLSFATPILTANLLASLLYNSFSYTLECAFLVALAFIFQELVLYTAEHIWNIKIRPRILFNVRQYIIKNIFDLKLSVINKYGDGLIEERIENDPNDVAKIVNSLQKNFVNSLTKVGIIIYIVITDYRISLVYIVGMLLVEYVDTIKQKRVKVKDMKLNNSASSASNIIGEVVEGMRDIKILNIENKMSSYLSSKLNVVANNISEKDICESTYDKIERVILYITMAMVIVFGMFFLNRGEITMVNLLIMYLYQNDVFSLMSEISNFRTSIKDFNSIMNKIVMLGDYKKFEKEKYGKVVVPRVKGKIKFDNVHFGYDEGKNVLNGMSFEINEKESVALVGTPECGKSTIVNLLMRSYDSHSGSITIDDVAIENFDETSLKNNISVVNQDSYIFNMSIKDNLLLVKSDATKSEIDFVCKKADIYNFINSLPDKYNTIVGMDGVNLSSAQRQKLAIARALLKGSQILIFEEATSSIDNVSQSEIQDSINNLVNEKTIITISHRLSATSKCDRILVIDKGKIVADGDHKNLITNCKVYKNLYKDVNKKIRF